MGRSGKGVESARGVNAAKHRALQIPVTMKNLQRKSCVLLPILAWLGACSSFPDRLEAERARYEAYAGAPLEQLTYLGRYDHWKPLSRTQLVIWTTPWDAYLINVAPPCADLPFVNGVTLTTAGFHTIYPRADFVKVKGGWNCQIEQIRPVDYRRMQADLKNQGPPDAVPSRNAN